MAETHRKTERTFAAQLRLLEEYPEYKYIQSQPAAYEMCRKYYPELFQRIKEAVKDGKWIAEGAMWVEPDTNMASGEALIRQLLYGKKYYKEEFGVDSQMLWLPDTFGYTAALPQILKSCGVKYLVTQKIFCPIMKENSSPIIISTGRAWMAQRSRPSCLPAIPTALTRASSLRLGEQKPEERSGCLPPALRLRRRRRRSGKRLSGGMRRGKKRPGRLPEGKTGESDYVFQRYGSRGRTEAYLYG